MELKTGKLILFRGPPQLRDARDTTDLSFILYDNHAITFIFSLQFLSQLFFPIFTPCMSKDITYTARNVG